MGLRLLTFNSELIQYESLKLSKVYTKDIRFIGQGFSIFTTLGLKLQGRCNY